MSRIVIAAFVGFLAAISVTAPLAQTVSSTVEGNNGGVFSSDPKGPSGTAVNSGLTFPGSSTLDFSTDGFGQAAQRPDGVGAVLADALFANGQTGNFVEARTMWTESVINNTGGPKTYVFQFFITPPSLRIADFANLADTDPSRPDISFHIVIRANGVPVFTAGANLIGGNISHVLNETGTSLSPSFVLAGSSFGYDFQSFSDMLILGPVAPSSSMTVEYEMVVRVDTPGFEVGGRAGIGDPFDLNGTPGFSGTLMEGTVATDDATWGRVKALFR